MADSDYTVAVVLQASDEGMSKTIKQTSNDVGDLGKKSKEAKIDLMATVVALEGLTSGLNQVTGGARKYSAALVQTNKLTQEQGEHLNRNIAYLELATGPLETMIALQKITTIVTSSETLARLGEIKVKERLTIVNGSLFASMMIYMVIIIAIIGVIYLLVQAFKHQEEIMDGIGKQVDRVTDKFRGMARTAGEVSHAFQEMASGAAEALDPMQRIIAVIPGLGGD